VKHEVILSVIIAAIEKEKKNKTRPKYCKSQVSITVLLFMLETGIAFVVCRCDNCCDCCKSCCINVYLYLAASLAIMMSYSQQNPLHVKGQPSSEGATQVQIALSYYSFILKSTSLPDILALRDFATAQGSAVYALLQNSRCRTGCPKAVERCLRGVG